MYLLKPDPVRVYRAGLYYGRLGDSRYAGGGRNMAFLLSGFDKYSLGMIE